MTTLRRIVLPVLLCASLASVANAANIVIVNNNAAGVGFNDPAPRAPVGGNPGTTLGDQRLNVFNHAASIWGGFLPSTVTIQVRAQFANQTCTPTSATLGSTSSLTSHRDFSGAPFPGTWYSQSLANKLFGADLSAANPDMNTTFNMALDAGNVNCLGGQAWYYGLDGLEGGNIELLPVALHEIGHGLNFATTTNGSTGAMNSGFPNIYDRFLLDKVTGRLWSDPLETNAQRAASAISNDLVWVGANAVAAAPGWLNNRPRFKVNSPPALAGFYGIGTAAFGPGLTLAGLTGNLVLVDDGAGLNINDGCEPAINAAAIAGNIAVVDRGNCTFVIKAQQAQAAGAVALIIVNNAAGSAPGLGGADPSITIPVISLSQTDGNNIKAQIGSGVNVTMDLDPAFYAGMDDSNRPKMFAPNPFQGGSSVSHWDVSMTPNTLMEPSINSDLHDGVDLSLDLFEDIGWFPTPTATTLARFTALGRNDGILLSWEFADPSDIASVTIQRASEDTGPWEAIETELGYGGSAMTALDVNTEPGATYYYRLAVIDRGGRSANEGMVSASRSSILAGRRFLGAPTPNPSSNGSSVAFRITRPQYVRLFVTDATGRRIRTLHEGMMLSGEYSRTWDGRSEHAGLVSPGVYFISLGTSEGLLTQRVAVLR